MEYVEGLTYDHVNFIFSGASHAQVLTKYLYKCFFMKYFEITLNSFICNHPHSDRKKVQISGAYV